MSIALARLAEERRSWRKDHPLMFYARPTMRADGSSDLMQWDAGIPGKEGTAWEGGMYKVRIVFSDDYPSVPPDVIFTPVLFHPNLYSSGKVCLSILDERKDWRPSITIKQILVGVQELLTCPNPKDPAQGVANKIFTSDPAGYDAKIRKQALEHPPLQ